MKRFRCGDVVPGCKATFEGSEGAILSAVTAHARSDHGVASMDDALVGAVRGAMVDA